LGKEQEIAYLFKGTPGSAYSPNPLILLILY